MPYKLEKVGGRYFVADDNGKRYSEKPMSKKRAVAQMQALYANTKGGDPASSFRVFKQADGLYRWVTISSSAFKDRDGEIVTEKALAEDCIRCDNVKEYGPLRWWHLGGYEAPDGLEKWETWKAGSGIDIGTCDFNMLHGKMLLESGTFKTAELGQAFADSQEKLEVSIAFSHPPGESKEYNNIHRFERSLLPEGMASNLLTKYYVVKGEASMKTTEKLAALVAILRGKPEAAKQILTDAEAIQKAAEVAGLEYKEVEDLIKGEDEASETPESVEAEAVVDNTPVVEENAPEAVLEDVVEQKQTPVEEPDEIGDMSHEQLKTFVVDIFKQLLPEKSETKEVDPALVEALAAVASLKEQLQKVEETNAQNKQVLDELTDSRPVGIKQLTARRPTESADNITTKELVGPHIDDSFMSFAQGGK